MEITFFQYNLLLLLAALALDYALGDPVYALHPIRLIGALLAKTEGLLFSLGWNTRAGGVLLFVLLAAPGLILYGYIRNLCHRLHPFAAYLFDLYLAYHLVAFRDLIIHARRVARAQQAGDLEGARKAAGMLVGRDQNKMSLEACGRAAVESVSENLVDGVISPLIYLFLFGVPGMLLFKIISTMDSMVGYKNQKYLRFGWFGARVDDALNYLPARFTWLLMVLVSFVHPGYSGRGCFKTGLRQHAAVPGPNAGWSECGAAGSLGVKIAGPIYQGGVLVNELWLGDEKAPEGASPGDVARMNHLAGVVLLGFTACCVGVVLLCKGF